MTDWPVTNAACQRGLLPAKAVAWLIVLALAFPASAQFGPTQIFRNAVKQWTGTLDVHGVASGTVTGPAATVTYKTDQHVTGNLTLDQYDPLTGAWTGTLDGTITITESAVITFACTTTNTISANTSAQSDFQGNPLKFNITFDMGSDTWSLWPSNNSVNGTVKSVQNCAGQTQTSTATQPMRFMPLNMKMGFPFPATGFDLIGTNQVTCDSCDNASAGSPVNYTFIYNLKANAGPQETVTTNPGGLAIVVDGAAQTAPQIFNWPAGSAHTIGVTSPQGSATRYLYLGWSDLGSQTHTITAPSTSTTYTANFSTQYLLTATASPAAGGSITADPTSPDGYYAPGTPVQLTVKPNCGYQFANWTGDLTGATNPQTVTMSVPRTVTANFTQNGATCTLQKAVMGTPAPGSLLSGSSVTFTWSAGSGASAFLLEVGTVQVVPTSSQGTPVWGPARL